MRSVEMEHLQSLSYIGARFLSADDVDALHICFGVVRVTGWQSQKNQRSRLYFKGNLFVIQCAETISGDAQSCSRSFVLPAFVRKHKA